MGIGANTALFNLVNGILLEKLPVRNPDELVAFRWSGENNLARSTSAYGYVAPLAAGQAGASFSFPAFEEFQRANQTLADLFAFAPGPRLNLISDGQADTANSLFVSGRFFHGLGISAFRGRVLVPEDDRLGAEPAIMISHEYWTRRFGMDPDIVGKSVTINGLPATVVGIAPPGIGDLRRIGNSSRDVSIPVALKPRFKGEEESLQAWVWWLLIMGRLKPGVTPAQVANLHPAFEHTALEGRKVFDSIQPPERLRPTAPDQIPDLRMVAGNRGIYDSQETVETRLKVLAAVLGALLLIVCLNLANLLLARTERRQQEIAVRMAIGATRNRVIRQLLTESAVLALLGGASGLIVASFCHQFFRPFLSSNTSFGWAALDWTALGFAALVSIATVLFFGLAPALRASRRDYGSALHGASTRLSRSRSPLGKSLIVIQVALSLLLLVGAGLFLETLVNLRDVNTGFNADRLALFTLDPKFGQYDEARTNAVYEQLVQSLAGLPGVRSVSFSSSALLSGNTWNQSLAFEGGGKADNPIGLVIHPGFFRTLEVPLKLGREFTSGDGPAGPPVAVVNEVFARTFLANRNPIGQRFGSQENPREIEIVGVVADTRYNSLRDPAKPMFFRPHLQRPGGQRTFAVRTAGELEAIVPALRKAVREIDPTLPLLNVTTQRTTVERNWQVERMFALVTALFGGLALAISAIGLFGLMSYLVARRTREVGIRMALGAQRGEVLWSVMREALVLVAFGVLIGLGAALATTGFLESLLFGLAPNNPVTIGGSVVIMLSVAALAGYLPARRASRVNPLVALRHE
ncbi:MAG: ABC transporter permease [Acidobacteriota bacterium]